MKGTVIHFLIRFFTALVPLFFLARKKLDTGSGNNGMGVDPSLLIGLILLSAWGIYMVYETIRFLSHKKKQPALVNAGLIIVVLAVFIYLGGL